VVTLNNILFLTFAVFCLTTVASCYTSVFAQPTANITNAPLTADEAMKKLGFGNLTATNTNVTATINDKSLYSVDVLFESPHTLILSGKTTYSTDLWKALDVAKESGYKIDAIAQVTESNAIGDTRYLSPVYTIFMSK